MSKSVKRLRRRLPPDIAVFTDRGPSSPAPVVLYCHSGAFVLGNLDMDHLQCVELARRRARWYRSTIGSHRNIHTRRVSTMCSRCSDGLPQVKRRTSVSTPTESRSRATAQGPRRRVGATRSGWAADRVPVVASAGAR